MLRPLPRAALRQLRLLVHPDTILRWHRDLLARRHAIVSRPRRPGLRELGVAVVDPHTWLLGGPALPVIREIAARNDPDGLLNPGKLPR